MGLPNYFISVVGNFKPKLKPNLFLLNFLPARALEGEVDGEGGREVVELTMEEQDGKPI